MRHPHEDPAWLEARRAKLQKVTPDPEIVRLEKEKRILTLKAEIKRLQEELKEETNA